MKRIGLVLALVALTACGVLRFPGRSTSDNLSWVFEIDTEQRTGAFTLSTITPEAVVARCAVYVTAAKDAIESGDVEVAYSIPMSPDAPTAATLRLKGDDAREVAGCTIVNMAAWDAGLKILRAHQ